MLRYEKCVNNWNYYTLCSDIIIFKEICRRNVLNKPGNAVITMKMNIFWQPIGWPPFWMWRHRHVTWWMIRKKLKNMVNIRGETKNFVKRMKENRKRWIIMPVEVHKGINSLPKEIQHSDTTSPDERKYQIGIYVKNNAQSRWQYGQNTWRNEEFRWKNEGKW